MANKTQILSRVIIYALALLSIAAGVPKVLRMPQEIEFLSAIGFSAVTVILLGVVQIAGGVLLVFPRGRLIGCLLVALALLVSSAAILASGEYVFAGISLLPFALAILVLCVELRQSKRGVS